MCGIIGLLMQREDQCPELGRLMTPMFDCMAERGPDSAGLAVFGEEAPARLRVYSLFVSHRDFDWPALQTDLFNETGARGQLLPRGNHALFISEIEPAKFKVWLQQRDPAPHLL